MATREEGKRRRREAILDAARSLIRTSDDLGFSMRALADEARVSIATPYNLFGSKQAILVAILDADVAAFQQELAALESSGIDGVFDAVDLMSDYLERDALFYRHVMSSIARSGGPELRHLVGGPRYLLWRRLLGDAQAAGFLCGDIDMDAFTMTLMQLMSANVQEWAEGLLAHEEMALRNRYGVALLVLGVATDASRGPVRVYLRGAERGLRGVWGQGDGAIRLEGMD